MSDLILPVFIPRMLPMTQHTQRDTCFAGSTQCEDFEIFMMTTGVFLFNILVTSCNRISHIFAFPLQILRSLITRLKKTLWSESASELYRPRDRRLSAKLLPTFADRGCHVVGVTDPYGRIPGFLDRSRYFSIK
jgi:hypothetical protein